MSDADAEAVDIFYGCHYCSGERECPRASAGSIRCSAGQCKKKQAAERAAAKGGLSDALLQMPQVVEPAASPRWCFKIKEVVGVTLCHERMTAKEKRLGKEKEDEDIGYLVRGKFGDDSDEDSDDMVPDTKWVKLSDLVEKINEAGCKELDAFAGGLQKLAKAARKRMRS